MIHIHYWQCSYLLMKLVLYQFHASISCILDSNLFPPFIISLLAPNLWLFQSLDFWFAFVTRKGLIGLDTVTRGRIYPAQSRCGVNKLSHIEECLIMII